MDFLSEFDVGQLRHVMELGLGVGEDGDNVPRSKCEGYC